jgi:hypothetical protein
MNMLKIIHGESVTRLAFNYYLLFHLCNQRFDKMYYYCIKTIILTPPPFSLDLVDYRHNVRIHCEIYRLFMAFV